MRKQSGMTLFPDNVDKVVVTFADEDIVSVRTVEINQGSDKLWVPLDEFKEFCRHLTEWANENG